jgi:hypothetical protein
MWQNLFYQVDKFLPRSAARLPYQLCLEALALTTPVQLSIWCRNSIYDGNFVFGISDLDVTAISSMRLSEDGYKLVFNHARQIKKIYPWLGEINLYAQDDLKSISELMNPYELSRDKNLIKLTSPLTTPTIAEKCVFILRMLYSDRINLKHSPEFRQKKWKGHFEHLGIHHQGKITTDSIKAVLVEMTGTNIIPVVDFFLNEHYIAERVCHLDTPLEWGYFFPHLFLLSQGFPIETENQMLKEIAIAQMKWEIAGIYTQRHWLGTEDYRVHFEGITKFYRSLTSESEGDRIVRIVNQLLDLSI